MEGDKITDATINGLSANDRQTLDYLIVMGRTGSPESELVAMIVICAANAEAMRRIRLGEQGRKFEDVFGETRLNAIRLSLSVLNEIFGETGV